jgi:hypothetical protein
MPARWCVLRCSGRATLRLAQSLAEDGFEVWTPAVTRRVAVPRMNAKREVTLPLLPGFAFAHAEHLWTLVERSEDPGQRFGFSVFRYLDRYPVIRDQQLDALRNEERKATPRDRMQVYAKGEEVAVLPIAGGAASAFGGMSGSVLRSNDRKTLVLFAGSRRVEFFTFDLQPIQRISATQAAKAA